MSDDTKVEIVIVGTVDDSVSAGVTQVDAMVQALISTVGEIGSRGGVGVEMLVGAFSSLTGGSAQAATALEAVIVRVTKIGEAGSTSSTALSDGLEKASSGAHEAEGAMSRLHLATSGAIKSYADLGQAVLSGDFSRLPGTLMSVATETGALDAATEALGAAFGPLGIAAAVVADAFVKVAVGEYEAEQRNEALAASFALTGRGATETADAVEGEIDKLTAATGVTRAQAEAIVAAEAAHAEWSGRLNQAADQVFPAFTSAAGDANRRFEDFKALLSDVATGSIGQATTAIGKLKGEFHILNDQARFEGMIEGHQRIEIVNEALGEVGNRGGVSLQSLQAEINETNNKLAKAQQGVADLKQQLGSYQPDAGLIPGLTFSLAVATRSVDVLAAHLKQLQAEAHSKTAEIEILPSDIQDQLEAYRNDVKKTDVLILQEQVGYLRKLSTEHGISGGAIRAIQKELASYQAELARTTSAEIIQSTRETAEQSGLIEKALVEREIGDDKRLLASTAIAAQAKLAIKRDMASKVAELNRKETSGAAGPGDVEKLDEEQAVNTARETSQALIENDKIAVQQRGDFAKQLWDLLQSGDRQSTAQRLSTARNLADGIAAAEHLSVGETETLEKDLASAVVNSAQLTAQQRIQIVRDEVQAEAAARKQAQREQEQIDAEATKTALAVEKDKFAQKKALAEEDLAFGRITEAQMVEIETAATQKMAKDEIDALQKQRDAWPLHSAKWEEFQGQMVQVQSAADTRIVELNAEAAKRILQEWQGILQPIESGFSQMISSMITSGGSFGKASKQMLLTLAADYVAARIKIEFDWLAGKAAMELGDQKWANESILRALFASHEQDAIGDEALSKQITQLFDAANAQIASQTVQTGAVEAGVAARTAVQTAGAAAGNAAEASADSTSIINSAYTAAASAFKWVMNEVPFPVNIALAPVVAAGTFAAVAAFDVISAAGGAESIPSDGQLIIGHKDESVLPARISLPLMDLVSNSAAIANIGAAAQAGTIRVPGKFLDEIRSDQSRGTALGTALAAGSVARTASFDLSGPISSGLTNISNRSEAPGGSFGTVIQDISDAIRHPASPQGTTPSRGGDTYVIQALDTSDFRGFLNKSANRRAMADVARDRRRAGERV